MKFFNKIIGWFKSKIARYKLRKKVSAFKATFTSDEAPIAHQLIDNLALDYLESPNCQHRDLFFKIGIDTIRKILPYRQVVGVVAMNGPEGIIPTLDVVLNKSEGEQNPRMSVEVISNRILAKTRRLSASLNMSDLVVQQNSPLKDEFTVAVSDQTALEIFQEILSTIELHSEKVDSPTVSLLGDNSELFAKINTEANQIAFRTRRGCAKIMIVDPMTATLLATGCNDFERINFDTERSVNAPFLKHIGRYSGMIDVFVNPFLDGKIILGYNGPKISSSNKCLDCGIVFAPYKILTSMGAVVDEASFDTKNRFLSRFDLVGSAEKIRKYYTTINVKLEQ